MQLVDKQNDLSAGVLDLLQEGFQPLLELSSETGPCDERAHVKRHNPLRLERLGNIPLDDPLGDPLGDRGFPHTRLPDKDGVVLGPPRKHLEDAAYLLVPPYHGVHFPLPGQIVQVAAVARERLVLLFGILISDPLRPPYLFQNGEDGFHGHPLIAEELPCDPIARSNDGQEQMLRAQVLIVKVVRLFLRRFDQPPRRR